jgi:hypothetical protein
VSQNPLVKALVRAKYWLIASLIVASAFASLWCEPHSETIPHADDWKLAASALGEVAAALLGALVTIYLVEATNQQELRDSIQADLRAELAAYSRMRDDFRRDMQTEMAALRNLRDDFRDDMQAAIMRYRLFGHWSDKSIIKRLNDRIFAKSLIRERHEIICTFMPAPKGAPDGMIDIQFDYIIRYRNLSASQDTTNPFVLALDKSVLVFPDGSGTLQSLTVAEIPPDSTTPLQAHIIGPEAVRIEAPAARPGVFTYTTIDRDALFSIPGRGGVEWTFSYVTRQKITGSENFVIRDLTTYFKLRVNHAGLPCDRFTFAALTDSDKGRLHTAPTWSSFEIADLLLPRQGVSLSWSCG